MSLSPRHLAALAASLAGCLSAGEAPYLEADSQPPSLLSSSPTDGAEDVDPALVATLVFDEPLDPATLSPAFRLADGDGHRQPICLFIPEGPPAAGKSFAVVVKSGTRDAVGCAPRVLAHRTPHTLSVAASVTDLVGNPLAAPLAIHFTTAPGSP